MLHRVNPVPSSLDPATLSMDGAKVNGKVKCGSIETGNLKLGKPWNAGILECKCPFVICSSCYMFKLDLKKQIP
jgi:hypothetical protein